MIQLVGPCITHDDEAYMASRITTGVLEDEAEVARFEDAFAATVGCRWAVAVNSGSNALVVALEATEAEPVVSIPSWTCVALRNALQIRGYEPRYVDMDFEVSSASPVMLVDRDDQAVVPHMFGRRTFTWDEPLIEDWTLSLGGVKELEGRLGVCSTHASKMISTGRGGVIFGDDPILHERTLEYTRYESHTGFGYSVGMSSSQAALGVSQLRQLDEFIGRRRELAHRYTEAFRPAGIECPDADCGSSFFRYLIRVGWPKKRVEDLAERGIEAGRGVYPPLHQLTGLHDDDFPGTMAAVNSLLSVPVHPSITNRQADHIIESVLQVCAP